MPIRRNIAGGEREPAARVRHSGAQDDRPPSRRAPVARRVPARCGRALVGEIAGSDRDDAGRRARSASTARSSMFATSEVDAGSASRSTSAALTSIVTPFRRAVRVRRLDRDRIVVDGVHGPEAEPRGSDSDHARAAAGVEDAAARGCREELDAGARRRMRACAERAARVDDDGELARRRRLPRRPDPEPAGADRAVEGAPALLPARLDGRSRCTDAAERRARSRSAPASTVDGELESCRSGARRSSNPPARARAAVRGRSRPRPAGTRNETGAESVAQRSALFRRLEEALVLRRPASRSRAPACGRSPRAARVARRSCCVGTATSSRTYRSPRARARAATASPDRAGRGRRPAECRAATSSSTLAAEASPRARSSRAPRRSSSAASRCAGRRRRERSAGPGERARPRTRCRRCARLAGVALAARCGSAGRRGSRPGTSTSSAALDELARLAAAVAGTAPRPRCRRRRTRGSSAGGRTARRRSARRAARRPSPPQVEHSRAPVPGSAPVAAQRSHGDGDLERNATR